MRIENRYWRNKLIKQKVRNRAFKKVGGKNSHNQFNNVQYYSPQTDFEQYMEEWVVRGILKGIPHGGQDRWKRASMRRKTRSDRHKVNQNINKLN